MRKSLIISFITIAIMSVSLVLSGCTNKKTSPVIKDNKINVMVSVLPQVDFVERIGREKVSVSEMIPPGFSPATYNPSPEQLKKLQDADIYFRIGHIPFEKAQMGRLTSINSKMIVVDTSEDIELLTLAAHHNESGKKGHEYEDEHEEDGDDPHIWLSPPLVKIQAKHIYDALVKISPKNKEYFEENYNQFITDLNVLDENLKEAFLPITGQTILVFHPSFGYLADAYSFNQKAIEIEGKEPSPTQLKEIIDEAKADNIKIIFVQAQFSTKNAEAIAQEIGGAVVLIDPLSKDYFINLESMAQTIVTSLNK